MKLLHINSVCGIGSTGRICADMAEVLVEQGHECKIAYGREEVPERFSAPGDGSLVLASSSARGEAVSNEKQ